MLAEVVKTCLLSVINKWVDPSIIYYGGVVGVRWGGVKVFNRDKKVVLEIFMMY